MNCSSILLSVSILIASFFVGRHVVAQKGYTITEFGARPGSNVINTRAIQACIDQVSENGGGTVIIPKGIFKSGSIFLKPNVNLKLERGAVLKGSVNQEDYPQIPTRWEGEEKDWTAALVNAVGLTNFSIYGEGTIDGSGEIWTTKANEIQTNKGKRLGRPRLIGLQNCSHVSINGLHLNNQASWGLFILYSTEVEVNGLRITAAHNIPSSDGIDICSSSKVHVTDTYIDVNDDCISLKSGKDEDGLRVNRPTENILIEKCHFAYGHGGVAMGSETSGGIRNVMIKDCQIDSRNWAPIRFKTQPSRGGVVENITYQNLKLHNTKKAFEFNMAWRMVNPKPAAKILPLVRNIKIIGVSGNVDQVGDMTGLKNSPISGVKFEDCHITANRGFLLQYVKNVDLSGLQIEGVKGEKIIRK